MAYSSRGLFIRGKMWRKRRGRRREQAGHFASTLRSIHTQEPTRGNMEWVGPQNVKVLSQWCTSYSEIPQPKGFTTVSQHHQMETKDAGALHTLTTAFVHYWEAYYTQSVLQRLSWEYKVLEGNDCTFLLIDCVCLVSVAATALRAKAIWKSLFQLTVGGQGRNLRARGSHWWHHPQWAEPAHINHQPKR